ncbi:MAG: 50S ribosomal protein L9 [Myxococcales bacterium]|nr:50S ribosomal protein L9 [Myxococcales bacterium]
MQVVLTEDLPNVGDSGEVVKVKPGYARNFLIPRGLASVATKGNVKQIEHAKRVAAARALKQRAVAQEVAKKLADVRVTLKAQVGEEQKLYGSITSRDIEEGLSALGFEIDRRKILLGEPIKELGSRKVSIKIASGVDAEVMVEVIPDT